MATRPGTIRAVMLAAALLFAAPVGAQAGEGAGQEALCVRNEDSAAHFFAAEAKGGERRTGVLAPGETLCVDAPAGSSGVVWVFEAEDAIEGCSRRVPAGRTEAMLRYSEFDRCAWTSNS